MGLLWLWDKQTDAVEPICNYKQVITLVSSTTTCSPAVNTNSRLNVSVPSSLEVKRSYNEYNMNWTMAYNHCNSLMVELVRGELCHMIVLV